ncbi:MAG TPA: type I glyceraldehyde-3-phosphate dehydrogenase [Candidatus Moranbacteria bacterium]|nr:type I glyceraldehyde-3-phosphate dehydrogenase [Candidatus Moranbacteria bacterium]
MKMKIAINGFGRIGRAYAKIILDRPDLELVAVNDLGELENLIYLMKYDTAYGVYEKSIEVVGDKLVIDGKEITILCEKDPANLPWEELGVDLVLESTGVFTDREGTQKHLQAGAKKVIISAPTKDETIKTIVLGCNEKELTAEDSIVSMASCTTNCIAPMIKVLKDNFGVEKSLMTTVHSYTATQLLVDGPGGKKDMRRGRAAAVNIIPSTTGAAVAATLTMSDLKGKFDGMSFRVPTLVGSASDVVAVLGKDVSEEEVNATFQEAAEGELKDIMKVTNEALVSADIIGDPHSVIIQSELTKVVDGNLVKVVGWYDNEWGYSVRLADLTELMR